MEEGVCICGEKVVFFLGVGEAQASLVLLYNHHVKQRESATAEVIVITTSPSHPKTTIKINAYRKDL